MRCLPLVPMRLLLLLEVHLLPLTRFLPRLLAVLGRGMMCVPSCNLVVLSLPAETHHG
jgi:hypothetical protein